MSAVRPGTASRLKTGQQQQQNTTAAMPPMGARPMGTASRLTTGMMRGGGGASMLNQTLRVEDRPMTQQGLGGIKTAAKGPRRQVEDKSYYIGVLRQKINELSIEVKNMTKEIADANEESQSFVQYEQMAENLAQEIKDLQGELGDYNTLLDKLNTDEDMGNLTMDYNDLRHANDREEEELDKLFEEKKAREGQMRSLEIEMEQVRRMADTLEANMNPEMRQKFFKLKDLNEHLLKQLDVGHQQLDELNLRKQELEEELSMSHMKQEAMRLYEQLHELEEKREQLRQEAESRGDPQQQREKLLKQVKEDNQELASMERQTNELREKLSQVQEELHLVEQEIEESQGERHQKYRELKKREEQMDEFMRTFDSQRSAELERMTELEASNVGLLEKMSRNMARISHLPSREELEQMKDQLKFKSQEMKKSENTTVGLAGEHQKLQQDLQKVEQLEAKITTEMDSLRERCAKMETELQLFSDLERLKEEGDSKRRALTEEKSNLSKRREYFKKVTQRLSQEYEAAKQQLQDNETFAQLSNLERKWQHHEQNNFVMKEFIAAKQRESDYDSLSDNVQHMLQDFNQVIQKLQAQRATI